MKILVRVIFLVCWFSVGVFSSSSGSSSGSNFVWSESDSDFLDSDEEEEAEDRRVSEEISPWLTEKERKDRYEIWWCPVGETEESLRESKHRHKNSRVSPCLFSTTPDGVYVDCYGSGVTQRTVEDALREVRRVNGIPKNRGVHIDGFSIGRTDLTQLDLAPFYGSRMNFLSISDNPFLTQLVTSETGDLGLIQVKELFIGYSPLKRGGFGDALKYFSNEMTEFSAEGLDLNTLDDSINDSDDGEFLLGLSALKNLTKLTIQNCNISGRVESDFLIPKELQRLETISLLENNITEIGENVFGFYPRPLTIRLFSNKLNESSFHPNSGIARAGRETALYLSDNQITSLPRPFFESFLDAHPQNTLDLYSNPLVCDERLSWIKSWREDLYSRIPYAYCSNDPHHTIFTSTFIPKLENNYLLNAKCARETFLSFLANSKICELYKKKL